MTNEYKIASYIRLSIDDTKSDSASIENQRYIINRRIANLDIAEITVREFIDNGYTGTNFERPAMQELLELVRSGEINCVVVKDFSRFGRSIIDVGYYLERIFPLYRVRFISVSDDFDSAAHDGGTGGMEVAFKFLMHEYYSIDLSRKIKTAKREKMLRGEAVRKDCAFGYKLDENRKMVIDEPAAETVRLIYTLAQNGCKLSQIVRELHDRNYPTPSEYRRKIANPTCIWNTSVIHQILYDEQYIGTYVAGKMKNVGIGSKATAAVAESEWVKIPNHHPAIVTQEQFAAVQTRRKPTQNSVSKPRKTSPTHSVYCGVCGHKMRLLTSSNSRYACVFTHSIPTAECHKLHISADKLTAIVAQSKPPAISNEAAPDTAHLRREKSRLYERYALGEIDADTYKTENQAIDKQLAAALDVTQANCHKPVTPPAIDRVCVYPNERVEVCWK